MEMKMKVFSSIGILAVLLVVFYLVTGGITKHTGYMVRDVDKFEECLDEKNIKLFIDDSEGLDNMAVAEYLDNFEIMNCLNNKEVCSALGIDEFPFWMIGDREIKRDISVEELAEFSGCDLN